jgi:lysozyme
MRLRPVFAGRAHASEVHHGPADGATIVRTFEGLALDPVVWANGETRVGYGHASYADPIDAAHANRLLAADLAATEKAVREIVRVPLSQNEAEALASLAHNIGLGAFARSSVVRHLQAGDKAQAADAILNWSSVRVGADWRPNAAVAERRRQERALFLGRG